MKTKTILIALLILAVNTLSGQDNPVSQYIDLMLLRGEYGRVIDTCKQILEYDKVDPEIYYRMGIAYQNTLEEDLALENFSRAYNLNPDDKTYSFMLAKSLYGKTKYKPAEQILDRLSSSDSLNWVYALYLTGIYMQQNRYDDAIRVYSRFLESDSANYRYLDKLGFAYLKKGNHEYATELYTKSLSLNDKDLTAIKNLAYLYSADRQSDTAIAILTGGIRIDPSDMSLYSLRAQIYYLRNYTKRALDDYLVILASGDSSELVLKRIGIGYCNNLQPEIAIDYLLRAHRLDSIDFETCSYIAQSYSSLGQTDKSILYYNKVINILSQAYRQLGMSYTLLASTQLKGSLFQDAITSYLKAQKIGDNPILYMTIANIFDEKLNDSKNAIFYYQAFLNGIKKSGGTFPAKYLDSIRDRIEYLKTNPSRQE